MRGRPDTNAENPKYLAEMVESLAYLSDEELAWLTHLRDGLQTVCKFLPTPADVHDFLRNRRARAEQFQPAHTSWRKIEDDPDAPWNEKIGADRKRRVVAEKLGYDPERHGGRADRNVVPPSDADLAGLQLKTPAASPSPHLMALLRAQDYPLPGRQDDSAAAA